jgi:hypothetical protein
MAAPSDEPVRPELPTVAIIVVVVLVIIGLFTVAGWLLGAAWALVRVGLLVAAVFAVMWAVRTLRS